MTPFPRAPILANDSTIQRAFAIVKTVARMDLNHTELDDDDGSASSSRGVPPSTRRGFDHGRPYEPDKPSDSDHEDPYEPDEGFPAAYSAGCNVCLRITRNPTLDMVELRHEHLEGPVWDILTGTNAYTELTNGESRREGMRGIDTLFGFYHWLMCGTSGVYLAWSTI